MVRITECKKIESYVGSVSIIFIIASILWVITGKVEVLAKIIAIGIAMLPVIIEIFMISEIIREFKFGEVIEIKGEKINVNKIQYDRRIERVNEFTKDEMELSIEALKYLLETEYKYEKYDKKFITGAVTISGIVIFFNNITTSFERFKTIFQKLSPNIIEGLIIIIALILVAIYFWKAKESSKEEKNNKINKALNKLLCDFKYYYKNLDYNNENYEYYL